ncbi:PAS domain S-box-containing protein [Streptomyces sp. 2333.5]|uniref:SpoIIE family protein phosphatase n=1 Tax=unclassified Streptomyces TaxID=2593676 RepID=UPI00089629AF|nr:MULTISPECIES: SpoIIE family protein phosphatase [unclassified Streptomyces]PJJ05517.1 PAS domain S-box-containing protein [Streptomyces sp. 2333.5]SEE77907.1 PAS domain S-box-containing protein [Streptomyces sp. 2314.4]SEF00256.1 PAS domain S-box-containing protein [Streptomyces sp. 2112.2]
MAMGNATPLGGGFGRLPDPATSATAVVDARGIVTGWSAGAQRLLGYPYEDVVGRPAARLLGRDADAMGEFFAALDGWSGTTLLRHQDGHRMEAELRAYASLDRTGNAQWLLVAEPSQPSPLHQEPPPYQREATADKDEATAEEAFAQCHLPLMIYDADLRALRGSAGAALELGLTEGQMRGRRVTEVLPPHVCNTVEEGMRRVFLTGEPERFHVHGRPRHAAHERHWAVTASPLRNPAGQVRHVQLIALDVTDQHRARERLLLLNDVSTQVGSTLDVTRTAQEMADVAVGRLADFISVDLLDPLFRGVEPRPSAEGSVALRRAAQQSVLPHAPESVIQPGDVDHYPESSPPARCLVTGRSSLHRTLDEAIASWQVADPQRAAKVRAWGMHSIMVIPLCARGITLGVAVLVRHQRQEPFDEDDLLLAEEIAARAAVAVDNARRFTRERTTALALQQSLLPQRLGTQAAVEVAYRYLPARSRAGLGGDWFDVIPLSGGRVALVVGDVVGHGLRASATMGRLRTAVRTLADVDLPPEELLVHLDDLVTHLRAEEGTAMDPELEVVTDLIATCLYLVYDPVSRHCTAAGAGHPPPAVVTPDCTAEFVDLPVGPPLGVGGLPFEAVEWEVLPGSLLVLYTDGLVEVPDHDLGRGMALLRQSLERPARSLEDTCDDLLQDLLPAQSSDDVALLIARTRALDTDQVATWDLSPDPSAVAGARDEVSRRLTGWGLDEVAFTAELVVSELVTNAIRYGGPPLQLRLIRDTVLICEVSDGSSTAPHMRRARTFDEGGRGLLLVAQFAERWGTRHRAGGKSIWAEIGIPN